MTSGWHTTQNAVAVHIRPPGLGFDIDSQIIQRQIIEIIMFHRWYSGTHTHTHTFDG